MPAMHPLLRSIHWQGMRCVGHAVRGGRRRAGIRAGCAAARGGQAGTLRRQACSDSLLGEWL